jgi:hypothetical protein
MTDAFLDGLLWSLIVIELLLGSVLLIGGIGWFVRWIGRRVDAMIEGFDHD